MEYVSLVQVYRSYKQDHKNLEKYPSRTFPELQEVAKRVGAVTHFINEASVRSDAYGGTTWGKIGETPVVRHRGGLKLIGAVSPLSARSRQEWEPRRAATGRSRKLTLARLADLPAESIDRHGKTAHGSTVSRDRPARRGSVAARLVGL